MAYVKQEWEDRQVENPMTFTMTDNQDGTITLTPQPGVVQNEGTKFTADRMNHIEEGIAGITQEKNIMTAYPSAYNTVVTKNNTSIVLDSSTSIGSNLTLSNSAIVIGKGITKVMISAQFFFQDYQLTGYCYPFIKKNDVGVAGALTERGVSGMPAYMSVTISPFLLDVTEGDKISLTVGDINDVRTIYRGKSPTGILHTYLTVEAVE